jgi:hypothetical protein
MIKRVGGRKSPPLRQNQTGSASWESGLERTPLVARALVVHTDPRLAAMGILAPKQGAAIPSASRGERVLVRPSVPTLVPQREKPAPSCPGSRVTLTRIDRPYCDLRHWQRKGDRLVGFYRTRYGSYEGYIKHPEYSRPEFYIVNPPAELWNHPHRHCFRKAEGDHYAIHFYPVPSFPDAGILEVERVLVEALTGQRGRNG